ncbi:MAG: hypothetical protein HC830_01105 [Bacteroidetes bacterium]|nr:hypothetical protein [Bacteroidota bacterium]
MFTTELEMSTMFERFLKDNFGNAYMKECQGLFGRPDFVLYSRQNNDYSIISFELKLKDWKGAAKQAFRYKSFSNVSYVVIAGENAKAALNNIALFEKYKIGLARFDNNNRFEIIYKPRTGIPYSENLNQKLVKTIGSCRKKAKTSIFLSKTNQLPKQKNAHLTLLPSKQRPESDVHTRQTKP